MNEEPRTESNEDLRHHSRPNWIWWLFIILWPLASYRMYFFDESLSADIYVAVFSSAFAVGVFVYGLEKHPLLLICASAAFFFAIYSDNYSLKSLAENQDRIFLSLCGGAVLSALLPRNLLRVIDFFRRNIKHLLLYPALFTAVMGVLAYSYGDDSDDIIMGAFLGPMSYWALYFSWAILRSVGNFVTEPVDGPREQTQELPRDTDKGA